MNAKRYLAGPATGLALLAACESGDPVSNAGDPSGVTSIVSAGPSTGTLPSGAVVNSVSGAPTPYFIAASTYAYGGFVPNATDAFGRKQTDATLAQRSQFYVNVGLLDTLNYYRFPAEVARVGAGERIDPRSPTLSTTVLPQIVPVASGGPAALWVFRPGAYSVGTATNSYYRVRTAFSGLTPGATYQLVFVHYWLTVNGELDQRQRILNGAVTEPDALGLQPASTPYAGTPNTTPFNAASPTCGTGPAGNTNPFPAAEFAADGSGGAVVDRCWSGGRFQFFGFSNDTPYDLGGDENRPYYNYIELWEGGYPADGVPTASQFPVLRIQTAQDLSTIGAPVPNTYPPFPAPGMRTLPNPAATGATAANPFTPAAVFPRVDTLSAYPLDTAVATNNPTTLAYALPGGVRVPDVLTGKLFNLQPLDNGVYKLWFINDAGTATKPATGTMIHVTVDADDNVTADTAAGVPIEFASGVDTVFFTLDPYTTILGTTSYADSLFFLLVTKESAAGATQPSQSQPLWVSVARIPRRPGAAAAGGNMVFGSYNGSRSNAVPYVAQGRVTGGVLGDTNTYADARVDLEARGLMQPPKGYEYHVFLSDTLGNVVDAGELKAPNGESLKEADVGASSLIDGRVLYDFPAGSPAVICSFADIGVYLYPKAEGGTPFSEVFSLDVPETVTLSAACGSQ